jgi:hypothetical protein
MNRFIYLHEKVKPTVLWFEIGDIWKAKDSEHIVEIMRNSGFSSKYIQYCHQWLKSPEWTMTIKIEKFMRNYERVP